MIKNFKQWLLSAKPSSSPRLDSWTTTWRRRWFWTSSCQRWTRTTCCALSTCCPGRRALSVMWTQRFWSKNQRIRLGSDGKTTHRVWRHQRPLRPRRRHREFTQRKKHPGRWRGESSHQHSEWRAATWRGQTRRKRRLQEETGRRAVLQVFTWTWPREG